MTSIHFDKQAKRRIQSWRDDWNKAAREMLRVRLASWQEEGLYNIQHNKRTSFCSATSMGKDFLGGVASWCFLLLVPKLDANGILQTATVINTGPSAAQVEMIMMGEIKSRYNGSILPDLVKGGVFNFRVRQNGIIFETPEIIKGDKRFANYAKWRLDGFKGDEHNVERWTGYHNENIMVVVTEASGIPSLIFEGIEGCLQNNSRLVLMHNPNRSSGEAYSSMKDTQYVSRRISAFESDNFKLGQKLAHGEISESEYQKNRFSGQLDYEWVKDHVNKAGWTIKIDESEVDKSKHDFKFEGQWFRPSDVCKIKILAVHPESSEDSLIPLTWIEEAQKRWLEAKRPTTNGIRAVDVAGMGRDTTTFTSRFDDYVDNITVMAYHSKETVHMETAGKIKLDADKYKYTLIDTIGEGAGVYSRLAEQEVSNVFQFKNSYNAVGLTDKTETRRFVNMRAYTHWAMRDWLDPQLNSTAMLPPDDELKAQLAEIKYIVKSDGRIIIEPKDDIKSRLGVSPDKSDGLAETFAPVDRLIQAKRETNETPNAGVFIL